MFKKALVFILILFFTAALLPLWIMWRDFQVSRLDADMVRQADAAVVLSTRSYEGGRLNPCLVAGVGYGLFSIGKMTEIRANITAPPMANAASHGIYRLIFLAESRLSRGRELRTEGLCGLNCLCILSSVTYLYVFCFDKQKSPYSGDVFL